MFAQASKKLMVFFLTLLLAVPTVGMTLKAEADAGPLTSSRKKGKRVKKSARRSARRDSRRSTSRRASGRRTVTRSGYPRRGAATTTVVSRRRVDDRRVVHTRSTRYVTPRRRTTIVHSRRRPVYRRTTVVNHYHEPTYRSSASAPAQPTRSVRGKRIGPEFFVMGNLGLSGLSAPALVDEALPGVDFNVVLGGRGELLGVDLGFNIGGYRLDPAGPANQADFSKVGMTLDLKLQPSLSIFEPYVLVGGGIYTLNDELQNLSSGGAGLRLGAGVDLRIHDSVGLGVGYTYETIGFTDEVESFGAQTETISAGLKIYF